MQETRLWRVANSAHWVAWGIVQAKIDGMDEPVESQEGKSSGGDDVVVHEESSLPESTASKVAGEGNEAEQEQEQEEGEEEEEFDYLAYAQERALFFWGDVLQLGLVKKEDLPAELLQKVKIVEY